MIASRYLFLSLISIALLASCKKDDPPPDPPPVLDGGVYILNEGNFQWGNASIDYLRFADGVYSEDIFSSANGRPLGDVVQSMCIDGTKAYIVVNNSGKVEVVDLSDFSSEGTINGFVSPRYFLPLGDGRAYVSDLYANAISIVDMAAMQRTGQIALHGSSEEMLKVGNEVFVTNTRTAYLYIVDITLNVVKDSIAVAYASNSLCLDQEGKIWVLCCGDYSGPQNAVLYRIDPSSRQILRSFDLGNPLQIWDRVCMNGSGGTLYFSDNGIWQMSIAATQLPAAPLIPQGAHIFHGIGVDPGSGNIYIADAMDYVQRGQFFRYSSSGTLLDSTRAGIIPSGFCFN
jgi:DNA-binding beta-propeller fold protein YncE